MDRKEMSTSEGGAESKADSKSRAKCKMIWLIFEFGRDSGRGAVANPSCSVNRA
jgi:hypothetical protein